jgi:hypothetical protein
LEKFVDKSKNEKSTQQYFLVIFEIKSNETEQRLSTPRLCMQFELARYVIPSWLCVRLFSFTAYEHDFMCVSDVSDVSEALSGPEVKSPC